VLEDSLQRFLHREKNHLTPTKDDEESGLHVVVAHCDRPVDWIWERYLKDVDYKSITIISKCGHKPNNSTDMLPPRTRAITSLPNVGRCDHSFAYFAKNIDSILKHYETNVNDQVMFMKDNDNTYRGDFEGMYTLQEMINTTMEKQFACASYVKTTKRMFQNGEQATNFAHIETLGSFHMEKYAGARNSTSYDFKSPIYPLGNWIKWLSLHNSIHIPNVTDLIPVCFGGHFMTTIDSIHKAPVGTWQPVLDSLSRGDNIEEGHFMERLWAAIFSLPISLEEQKILIEQKIYFHKTSDHPFNGLLVTKSRNYERIQEEIKNRRRRRGRSSI
jgi:hypothetical protein